MAKLRNRLTLIFILLIGLSNILAGVFVLSVVRDSQISSLERQLSQKLALYVATLDGVESFSGSTDPMATWSAEALEIAGKLEAEVAFFDVEGRLIADSAPLLDLKNNSDEFNTAEPLPPEIIEAMQGGLGLDRRSNPSENADEIMYMASPAMFGATTAGYVRFGQSLAGLKAEIWRIGIYLFLGMLVILMVTAVIAYRISRNLTNPLEKITRVANQISNMNYLARVPIQNQDEIGQLGIAINKMSESLQFQMQQIQENESRLTSVLDNMISGVMTIDRDERVTLINRSAEELLGLSAVALIGQNYTRMKTQGELVRMVQQCLERHEHIREEVVFYYPEEHILDIHLAPITGVADDWSGIVVVLHDITPIRRLERMRSEFVSNVSHELKTPIAAVKGFAETLLGGAVHDPETAKSFLQIIYDESDRLNRLIGDILDLSKIESKRVPLHFSPIEMKPFIAQMFQMMHAEANKKSIRLEEKIADGIFIEADEDRLRQIFINLLSNAITYSHDEGWIRVTVEQLPADEEHVRITVEDSGIGIPRKDLPRIFERFYRVDKARTRLSGGTGLGLSIVKHLVELHKGNIRVESVVGVGTRFIVDLPVVH